jgi:CCR4-NOT transcriptional complex subunit CAF120
MWMIVSASTDGSPRPDSPPSGTAVAGGLRSPHTLTKKKRMSTLFSRDSAANQAPAAPSKPQILMFASQKPKDRKKPLLTLHRVTQAFAVYPERPELISRSTLIKMEGLFGVEETAGAMKSREGWLLMMPEPEGGLSESAEMLKWVVGKSEVRCVFGLFLMSLR